MTNQVIIVSCISQRTIIYRPIYIHSFRLLQPHNIAQSEKFNITYTNPLLINNTADKLRWYRYKKGLRQRDVAEYAGMDSKTYADYENVGRDFYPTKMLEKIADLLEVPVTELMDEYNRSLYNGQGKQIRLLRSDMGVFQRELADILKVDRHTINR